ncbi:hypothetical protein ACH5RR_027100 [Cinchona calisaya]|uniref:BHLH domain-containing protein n=1 Tax=Cinchona calisaya TaxID=153742 RepID=A0ABD2Z9H2_9GENT
MEPMAAFLDEEWASLSKMFSSEDADNFMLQLHGHELLSNDYENSLIFQDSTNFWPANIENMAGVGDSFFCYDDTIDCTNFENSVSQESSNSSSRSDTSVVFPHLSHDFGQANYTNVFQVTNGSPESMDFYVMDKRSDNTLVPIFPDGVMEDIISPREEMGNAENQPTGIANSADELLLKRKFGNSELQTAEAEPVENPKRKPRVSRNAEKTKRNVQPKSKRNQKVQKNSSTMDEEEANATQNGQSSCSYSSEDNSNASNNKEPALTLNGKTRASRGSATDPQSLYARKRRERINERLRILQNLVPNGTKVDISTMLEEAVHYVKFMQLQIKLLSSDDMWMYAPLVHNGLDIGLYGRSFPTL